MMMAFFLAMVLYPNVQKAAQTELDRVVGPFTAPDFSYRPDLDYIEAVLRETFRWHQVLPLGSSHPFHRARC
jgi:cytochrome P450